ncbi:MAG: hypothetical protein JZU52_20375, partial [Lamprocystis purpurea]|nr:hypothetical protein [Lamprocystis purpurea]
MEYRHHKDFMSSVRDLYQKGGLFQKAALQVRAILGGIGVPDTYPFAGFRQTKHGENRVSKCLKYDLIGFARLITITEKDV